MTLILDAAPLVALADARDERCELVAAVIAAETGRLVIAAPVTAEVDYLLGRRIGRSARLAFIADLAAERFRVDSLDAAEHATALSLEKQYADLDLGLADAATIVLAHRHDTLRICTFDHRHFRAVTPLQGGAFELLP
ncbi:MAG: type II toxin-antitoxin system VapC family toxin [Sporichthyaceae bacterium]